MKQRLPPLNTLRVFEATARLLSAKDAAEELHVTPAAVSHQIKQLEEHLEIKLFVRRNRRLILTEEGQRYSIFLQELFKTLVDETNKVTKKTKSYITVSVEPAFALHWLIPRIPDFRNNHPHIDLRISASYDLIDFKSSDMDVAIRWGKGQYPGLRSELLFQNEVFPICHPSVLKPEFPIQTPNDLKHYTLLHERMVHNYKMKYPTWKTWTKAANAMEVDANSGLFFENGILLIQALMYGQGIALERGAFFEKTIQSGQLIRIFDFGIKECCGGYYVAYPEAHLKNKNVEVFLAWLNGQIM